VSEKNRARSKCRLRKIKSTKCATKVVNNPTFYAVKQAGVQWGGNGVPTPFALVMSLEDLDFSFQFLHVEREAA